MSVYLDYCVRKSNKGVCILIKELENPIRVCLFGLL